ncbi:PREDICTED: MHC class II transactivator-like [Branchiostoma belcheri]|uniref:MHC class II transactivator-like n=1 Tax=Branchiostoma belcheri TaxID=7741 RepID=A0A6P4ZSU0_BRABE|nr:PREDICTED: MHC class II transactivator-like [Branchiostoma belcheri]
MAALSRQDMYLTPSELVSEDPFPHVGNDVTSYLKDFYRTQFEQERPLLLREEHELHLPDVYTDPHIQCRGDIGQSNDVSNVDSLTKIFLQPKTSTSQRNPKPKQTTTQRKVRKVHLEGSAGTGKSISCKKLAYDWATGKLTRFLLVFLIELRYITGGILDAIFDQILYNDMYLFSKQELHDYILQHPDQILFVIDGLQEVSSHSKLFQETILQKCHVLVTSRPYPKPLELDHCDTFCKIMGYTKENSLNYAMKFFKDNEETSRQVLTKVEETRSLRELAVNPLDIMLICSIWKDTSGILISGKTELYMAAIHCLVRRFCSEKGLGFDLKDHSIQQLLRCLGKLAWDGLRKVSPKLYAPFIP